MAPLAVTLAIKDNMAQGEVTGWTREEMLARKHEWEKGGTPPREKWDFEEAYCLVKIGKQPEDYDGPQRYCSQTTQISDDGTRRSGACKFHGLWKNNAEHLEEHQFEEGNTAAIKHGMYADDERLKEVFTEADQQLYDFIMSWADAYGWPSEEEDPSRYYLLERLAINAVRTERSERYLDERENGVIQVKEVFDPKSGHLQEIEETHPLFDDIRKLQKLLLDIMKELGITPKERRKLDAQETEASAADQIAEIARDAVVSDEHEYDPAQFDE
jgi:hypothetical protein